MVKLRKRLSTLGVFSVTALPLAAVLIAPAVASAQEDNTSNEGDNAPQPAPAPGPSVVSPIYPYGLPQPGFDPNAHLPSSSRGTTDTSKATDGFDLNQRGTGSASSKGSENGQFILEGGGVPQAHSVKRGDTLWSISGQYYRNPYNWPRLWSHNPQIQNPHWIYPGDRVWLREKDTGSRLSRAGVRGVPESTVFLREIGWVDDPEDDTWGEIVGSPHDHVQLVDANDVYMKIDRDVKINLGDELTIFRPIRSMKTPEGEGDGQLVNVRGTVRIDKFNKKTRIARGRIIESIDTIERGASIGPMTRKFTVTPPVVNQRYVEARILTASYPHVLFGQDQVIFLDRGEKDGVKPGNRFLAVRRGDRWVESLDGPSGEYSKKIGDPQDDRDAPVVDLKDDGPMDLYPDELYAEIRVITVRKHTCMAIITEAAFELERDAVLVMKKGY